RYGSRSLIGASCATVSMGVRYRLISFRKVSSLLWFRVPYRAPRADYVERTHYDPCAFTFGIFSRTPRAGVSLRHARERIGLTSLEACGDTGPKGTIRRGGEAPAGRESRDEAAARTKTIYHMPRESPKRRSKRGLRGEDPETPKQLNAADFAQREGLYRTLVERIPGIVYISEFGPFAKWHYVSPQIPAYLGYTPEEWMADASLWMKHVHPEDRELVLAEENRLVKTGKAFFAEYRMVARDGRVLWFRDESLVFRKPGPYPPLLYGILYDVTERKAAEEALREFQERLRDTVNNAPLVVFSIDAKGTFLLSEGRGLAALG